jgi:hypothetical protein
VITRAGERRISLAIGLLLCSAVALALARPGLLPPAWAGDDSNWTYLPLIFPGPPTSAPSATTTPTIVPTPTLTSTVVVSSTVRQGSVVLRAYPYETYLVDAYHPYYNMRYRKLNWGAYDSGPRTPVDRSFIALILENEYLRVTVLPELGGRVYECIFKPTGHDELYRNPVLKPTHWGPTEQGWWLALGGIEWCLPVAEHGYESGVPWSFETLQATDGVTVTVHDSTAMDRLRASVDIALPAGRAYFTISPHVENPTTGSIAYKFWLNAMCAPGGTNAPSDRLQFALPVTNMTVHSRDDRWTGLPGPAGAFAWPMQNGRDLSLLGNWPYYLGAFERPAASGDFVAVYERQADEGLVRAYPSDVARGAKVFSAGYGATALSTSLWTDDHSSYVELHGGVAPTFDDAATLAPGGRLSWTEHWYPVTGIGGVSCASREAALNLQMTPQGAAIGVATTTERRDSVVALRRRSDGALLAQNMIPVISPAQPFVLTSVAVGSLSANELTLIYSDSSGALLAACR